jgi:hypothetical protein
MTSVTVWRRKSSTQPAIRVTKLAIDEEVKQPENACSRWTKEATMMGSDTFRFLCEVVW